jgi:hypothetical protein
MAEVAVMPPSMLDTAQANQGPKKKKRNKISQVIASECASHVPGDHGEQERLQSCSSSQAQANPVDEIPIPKAGPKSFEELLEQELAKEGAQNMGYARGGKATPSQATFLKRGANSSCSYMLRCSNFIVVAYKMRIQISGVTRCGSFLMFLVSQVLGLVLL